MSTLIDHVHLSGFYGAEEGAVRAAYQSAIDRFGPDFLTGTECEYPSHKKALASFEGTYNMRTSSVSYSDDSVILWKADKWKLIHFETFKITNIAYINEKGLRRDPTYAKIAILENIKTGDRVLVSTCHLPSSVQRGGGFAAHSSRVRAWLSGVKGWRKRRNDLYREYKCDAMLVSADWNVDFHVRALRTAVKVLHPTMKFALNVKALPKGGTHGNRLIDFSLIRGRLRVVNRPVILAKSKASDHAPYREVLALTDK